MNAIRHVIEVHPALCSIGLYLGACVLFVWYVARNAPTDPGDAGDE